MKEPQLKLPEDEAQLIVSEDHEKAVVVLKEFTGKSRWSDHYRLIFKLNEKLYEVFYSKGATEQQEGIAFDCTSQRLVPCFEVEPYEKMVTDYRRISVGTAV